MSRRQRTTSSSSTGGGGGGSGGGGSGVPMASPMRLNLSQLRDEFAACVKNLDGSEEDILLQHYVNAYTELLQILKILGRVFYFVVQDVHDKLNILSNYLRDDPDHYRSLSSMVHFERDQGRLTRKGHPPNGSRTYLRLHRALLFIYRFVQELVASGSTHHHHGDSSNHPTLGEMTHTVYTETLSQHHAWLLRKGVGMAVHTLPSRADFFVSLCRESGTEDRETLLSFLRDSLSVIHDTYAISQRIYAGNELMNLE